MVMDAPTGPCDRLSVEMLGPGLVTVNATPLLNTPPTVTTTLPVVAPFGTGVAILVAVQFAGAAAIPLKVTVLDPWLVPKFAPAIVTEVPMAPEFGVRLLMLGGRRTAKLTPRSEEHTSELQSPCNLVCRLLLEKKKKYKQPANSDRRPDIHAL